MAAFHSLALKGLGGAEVITPSLAFGTGTRWYAGTDANSRTDLSRPLIDSIKAALHAGFRHIDAAEIYGTEQEVGVALTEFRAETGVKRSELFVTTKVIDFISDIPAALAASLSRLGPAVEGYVDLYLIHNPFWRPKPPTLGEAWLAMEAQVKAGKARAIGVSNFRTSDFEELYAELGGRLTIPPAINQIEFHPRWQSNKLRRYQSEKGILTASYGGLGPLVKPDTFPGSAEVSAVAARIAEEKSKATGAVVTPAQVYQAWLLKLGALVVTTTSKAERLPEFLRSAKVAEALTDDDVKAISEAAPAASQKYRFFASQKFDDVE
ncbi:putative ketoreductase [Zopfochytrium polystomum]|nr:putative ketoreductase [Zopfochytrium polystomum]